MSSLDGQSAWRDLWNRLDNRSRQDFFRLNLSIPGDGPAMDEVDRMNELRVAVNANLNDGRDLRHVGFALIASSFFFELTSIPFFHCGKFYCRGAIRCRLNGRKACNAMARLSRSKSLFMNDNEILGHFGSEKKCCEKCHRYQKHVEFVVRDLAEPVSLYIQNIEYGKRTLEGFPKAMEWFLRQQKLEAYSCNLVMVGRRCCESERHLMTSHSSVPKRKMTDRQSPVLRKRPRSYGIRT